ncbi:hypothetical protein [Mycobacterium sp. AZCC_0083]|uniref:hypothetical protein n=1 Tax=Mycobacterium sp. AZCC_0083 TaxID=2735882 RepID=UPI00161D6C83|nr:hypothetical protein [Mycobacterium sp. AZCC_0083]MBB5166274.1 hypothetical protein [Mycobacterium sp. AZCC_0083]
MSNLFNRPAISPVEPLSKLLKLRDSSDKIVNFERIAKDSLYGGYLSAYQLCLLAHHRETGLGGQTVIDTLINDSAHLACGLAQGLAHKP